MYETIRQLYLAGKLSDRSLTAAVKKGWITQDQAKDLKAAKANG